MAKSVPRFKPNRESVAIFKNSNPIESSNKHPESEDHMRRRMEQNANKNLKIIENYKRLVIVEVNNGYSTKY